jgi:NADPH:quinone reductase-like Zn-dependent oxidoreductase
MTVGGVGEGRRPQRKSVKAIVYKKYGPPDLLEYREVERPSPKDDQVLVRVRAASVNALDYRRFEKTSLIGRLMDEVLLRSVGKVLGADIAGQVEAVGASTRRFRPGDEVFGVTVGLVGGFAEYACAVEHQLALKPQNISFEAAAAVPVAASTALKSLRETARIRPGQQVLIHGASGGVGTFAVQIAKSYEAEVTAVCSTRNLDIVQSAGADHVIDYTREDFTRGERRYDLIIAVNGDRPPWEYRRALSTGGVCLVVGGSTRQIFGAMLFGPGVSILGKRKVRAMGVARVNLESLAALQRLLAAGKIAPVIDRGYPLAETAKAIQYLVEEHARGKVVITCGT